MSTPERSNPEQLYEQLAEGHYADTLTAVYHEVLDGAEGHMYFGPRSSYQTSQFVKTTLQPIFIAPLPGQTTSLTRDMPVEVLLVIFSQDEQKRIVGHNHVPLTRNTWGNIEAHEDIATRIRGKGFQGGLDLATLLHLQLLAFSKNETISWTIENANKRMLNEVEDILTHPEDKPVVQHIQLEQERWQAMYYNKLGFNRNTNVRIVAPTANYSRWTSPDISDARLITMSRERYAPLWIDIRTGNPEEIQHRKREEYKKVILPEILATIER